MGVLRRFLRGAVLAGGMALALAASAQEAFPGRLPFQQVGGTRGLPQSTLHAIYQDREGFIWLGTELGLWRYDGTGTAHWGTEQGLPSSWVVYLLPRAGGGIWVGTSMGFGVLEGIRIRSVGLPGQGLQPGIGGLTLDASGRLWVSAGAIYRENGSGGFELIPGLGPEQRPAGLEWSRTRSSLFVITASGLSEFRDGQGWKPWGVEQGLDPRPPTHVWEDGQGWLWTLRGTRLLALPPGQETFQAMPEAPFPISVDALPFDGVDGWLRIPTQEGLLSLKGEQREFFSTRQGAPACWIRTGLEDREGNLWLLGASLYRLKGRGCLRWYGREEGLPGFMVSCLQRDLDGRLFAGGDFGVAMLGPQGWKPVKGISGSMVGRIRLLPGGDLLLLSFGEPLQILPRGGTKAEPFGPLAEKMGILDAAPDGHGGLYLAWGRKGLFHQAAGAKEPELIHPSGASGSRQNFKDAGFFALDLDGQGRLWAAGSEGLYCRRGTQWLFLDQKGGLHPSVLEGMHLTPSGDVWVWYHEPLGLTRVRMGEGGLEVAEHRNSQNGLDSNLVYDARGGADGTLWVGTDRGVDALRQGGGRHIGQADGMLNEDCTSGGLHLDVDGSLWVGTSAGMAHIKPEILDLPLPKPEVRILPVNAREAFRQGRFPEVQDYGRVRLELRLGAPSFVDERAVQYETRLLGLEEDWQPSETARVQLKGLREGEYTLQARARYLKGDFGEVAALSFRVRPPWYRSYWAYGGYFLLVAGAAGGGARLWTLRLARQKRRLEEQVAERTEEVQAVNQALCWANDALLEANRALESQSLTDALTGLHNRRYLSLILGEESAGVLRRYRDTRSQVPLENQDLVFFLVDLDHFKRINDAHGHGVGDRVLQCTSETLRHSSRETDAVVRWGGEEFLVVTRGTSRHEAPIMAERIRLLMAEQGLDLPDGSRVSWTCSVGFAPFPFHVPELDWLGWERVLEVADACLYTAKRMGRNAWVGVSPTAQIRKALHGPRLPQELQALVQEGALEVFSSHDDPFRVRTGSVMG